MAFERSQGGILVPEGWSGIFPNMPSAEYHQRAIGIASAGALKLVRKSLAHYAHWARSGDDRRSRAMDFGRAYHAFVLEPENFYSEFVVIPKNAPKRPDDRSRNAKNPSFKTLAALEFWDDFDRKHAGKEVITAADYQKVQDMRAALDDVDMVGELPSLILTEGKREVSMRWVDEETGLPCRLRKDYWHEELAYGLDLKSCADAGEAAFTRAIVANEYDVSQAHYLSGAHALDRPLRKYLFLSQETTPPYVAVVNQIGSSFEELGFAKWRAAMNRLATGVKTGKFPGYSTGIRTLEAPAYAFYNEETQQ